MMIPQRMTITIGIVMMMGLRWKFMTVELYLKARSQPLIISMEWSWFLARTMAAYLVLLKDGFLLVHEKADCTNQRMVLHRRMKWTTQGTGIYFPLLQNMLCRQNSMRDTSRWQVQRLQCLIAAETLRWRIGYSSTEDGLLEISRKVQSMYCIQMNTGNAPIPETN